MKKTRFGSRASTIPATRARQSQLPADRKKCMWYAMGGLGCAVLLLVVILVVSGKGGSEEERNRQLMLQAQGAAGGMQAYGNFVI